MFVLLIPLDGRPLPPVHLRWPATGRIAPRRGVVHTNGTLFGSIARYDAPVPGGRPDRERASSSPTSLTEASTRGSPLRYFQVTSIAKKWSNTSRFGWLASFFSGLRI